MTAEVDLLPDTSYTVIITQLKGGVERGFALLVYTEEAFAVRVHQPAERGLHAFRRAG